jgi:calcyclin binding protein
MSTRNYSKEILISLRLTTAQELKSLPEATSEPTPQDFEGITWKPIDRFSWEQTETEVKIYVTSLEGLKSHPKENIHLHTTKDSVTVSIKNFQNSSYRLKFPKLTNDITGGKVTQKSNGFSVTLIKKDKTRWDSLVPKKVVAVKEQEEEEEGKGDTKDAGDSLMKMMKELYETGDDDMKKTIAEAWSKAKNKEE